MFEARRSWPLVLSSLILLAGSWSRGAASDEASLDADPVVEALPGAEAPLSLDDCVLATLQDNPGLLAEREGRGEVRGLMLQTISSGLPTLDVAATWSRARDPSFALDATFGGGGEGTIDSLFSGFASFVPSPENVPPQSFWRASVDATWDVKPFKLSNSLKGRGLVIEQQEQVILDAEHRTTEEVVAAYFQVVLSDERLRALDAELTAREETAAVSRRRFYLELDTALDTLQAAVSVANLEPQVRRAREELRQAGQQLNLLMGRDPLEPISVLRQLPGEEEILDESEALARAVQRPDVRRQELEVDIQKRARGARKAEIHPYLRLSGSYGYVGRRFDELSDEGHDFWNVSVGLVLPVFDGLLAKGQIKETEAHLRRAEFETREVRREARREVSALLGELEAARQNLTAARLNMARATDALGRVQLRYELGKAQYLEVLNAQSERFAARSNLIQARFDVITGTASLKRAVGVLPHRPMKASSLQEESP